MSSGSNVWHEWRQSNALGMPVREVLCGGRWYEVGTSPCELMDEDQKKTFAIEMPACEESDEDLRAAQELLGLPERPSRCNLQDRASWFKPDPAPRGPQVGDTYERNGVVWTIGNPRNGVVWTIGNPR